MYIDEHPSGTKVTLKVIVNHKEYQFQSAIVPLRARSKNKYIAVRPIIGRGGKPINFHDREIAVSVCNEETNRTYEYLVSRSGYCRRDSGQLYMILFSEEDAKAKNYRQAYRYALTGDATISLVTDSTSYDCQLHNISVTGLGVVCEKELQTKFLLGEKAIVRFSCMGKTVSPICTVARISLQANEDLLIGLKLIKYDNDINKICSILMKKEVDARKQLLSKKVRDKKAISQAKK